MAKETARGSQEAKSEAAEVSHGAAGVRSVSRCD